MDAYMPNNYMSNSDSRIGKVLWNKNQNPNSRAPVAVIEYWYAEFPGCPAAILSVGKAMQLYM